MKVSKMIGLLQQMPQDLEVYNYVIDGQGPEVPTEPNIVVVPWSEFKFGIVDGFMTKEGAIDSGWEESDLVEIVLL